MKTLTEKELRELDAWLCEHAMHYSFERNEGIVTEIIVPGIGIFHPTTDPAAAMEVLKKCSAALDCEDMKIGFCTGNWSIETVYRENPGERGRICVWALPPTETTLELAICLFARKLFA